MKKLLLALFLAFYFPEMSHAVLTPARNISVETNTFANCLNSSSTNVQSALNSIDVCFANFGALNFIESLVKNGSNVSLVNDSASPGNSYYYGTNASGTKGFFTIPATGVTSVATSAPITGGTITTTGTIGITQAGSSGNGYLSSTDWNTFNNKQANLSLAAGAYTNSNLCTYASSGTLLNCNTPPASVGSNYWNLSPGNVGINTTVNDVGIGTSIPLDLLEVYGSPRGVTINSNAATNGIDSNTELMLSLNNTLADSSQNAATVTSSMVTFSNSSPAFAGSYYGVFGASSYLTIPNAAWQAFGTGNFTFDGWVNFTTLPTNGNVETIVASRGSSGSAGFILYVSNNAGTYQFTGGLGGVLNNTGNISVGTGAWHHYAFVRSGNTFNSYFDGVSVATTTSSSAMITSGEAVGIGTDYYGNFPQGSHLTGSLSEFRISNIARWTSNFTPPANPYSGAVGIPIATFQVKGSTTATIGTNGNINNNLEIADGSAQMDVTPAGNFGLGSTSPGQTLDVNGGIRTINGGALAVAGSSFLAGNVGIGINNPSTALDVSGNVTTSQIQTNSASLVNSPNDTWFTTDGSTYMEFGDSGDAFGGLEMNITSNQYQFVNSNLTVTEAYIDSSGNLGLDGGIKTGGNVGIGTNLTSNAALSVMNGNVGIGTWVPSNPLTVVSATGGQSGKFWDGTSGLSIGAWTGGGGVGAIYQASAVPGSTNWDFVTNGSATNLNASSTVSLEVGGSALVFLQSASLGITPNTSFTNNVGIGTTFIGGTGEAALSVMNGNVGIGTWLPVGALEVGKGNTPNLLAVGSNVSIGTKTAGSLLTVGNAGQFTVSTSGNLSTSGTIASTSSSANTFYGAINSTNNTGSSTFNGTFNSGGAMGVNTEGNSGGVIFSVNDGGSYTPFIVNSNDNVGIGTASTTTGGTLTIGGKCLGITGIPYLQNGVMGICTVITLAGACTGTFTAC